MYHLKAQDLSKNIKREYVIFESESLFGDHLVNICYGRQNSKGHHITLLFNDKNESKKYVEKAVKKRLTSEKRIGCNYELINKK